MYACGRYMDTTHHRIQWAQLSVTHGILAISYITGKAKPDSRAVANCEYTGNHSRIRAQAYTSRLCDGNVHDQPRLAYLLLSLDSGLNHRNAICKPVLSVYGENENLIICVRSLISANNDRI